MKVKLEDDWLFDCENDDEEGEYDCFYYLFINLSNFIFIVAF